MKFKKMMLVMLLLLAVLTIGAVSASEDVNATAAAIDGDDLDVRSPLDDEILSLENTDIAVGDGNFTDGGDDGDSETGPDAWFSYEKVYTDSKEDLVSVSVPYDCNGTIYVEVNEVVKASWEIEHYDEVIDSYYGWKVSDLEIYDAGNYALTVKLDDEILNSKNITVYEFNNDEFRAMIDYENELISFYCPNGTEGTLRLLTYRHYDEGEQKEFDESHDLADYQGWSEWKFKNLGFEYDGVWTEFIFKVVNTTDDEMFYYAKGYATTYNGGDGPEEKYNVTIHVYRPDEVYYIQDIGFWGSVEADDNECEFSPEGEVTFYLNDEEIGTDGCDFSFYVTFNEFQEYNFKMTYSGDNNFNPSEINFTYNLTNSMYMINVENEVAYPASTFGVYSPGLNPNDIEITVNGKKFIVYEDDDGDYRCNASGLNYGLNTVHIYYPGDEDFGEYSDYANITLISIIQCDDYYIDFGNSAEIYVELPDGATGTLTVYSIQYDEEYNEIDTEIASSTAKDGVARVALEGLSVGSHRIYANFTGSVETAGYGAWIEVKPIVKVPKTMITGEDAYVVVETSKDANDLVEVSYLKNPDYDFDDEIEYTFLASANTENGQAKIALSSLDEGYYHIFVNYIYDGSSIGQTYHLYVVDEYDVNVNITYFNENVLVGSEGSAEYEIAEYADGNITVIVDGKILDTLVVNGEYDYVYFNTTGLSIGEHTLTLNFTSETQGTSFDEVKFNLVSANIYIPNEMNINSQYVSANNIAVAVNSMAVGTIRILIDGKEYMAEDIDAVATEDTYYHYALSKLSRGKHNVTVIYSDDKYGEVSESKTVDFGYEIVIYEEHTYGVDNIITVRVPNDLGNGDLTITLDGNKCDFVRNASKIEINPSKLSIGNHTVIVKYAGDDFYPASEVNDTFEVYSSIDYKYRDMLMGSDEGVSLILPGDAKGKLNVTVFVEIDDEDGWRMEVFDSQLVSFVNGKAYYSFASLPEGSYYAEASYTGDDYEVYDEDWYFEVTALDIGDDYLSLGENKTIIFVSADDDCQLHIVFSKIVDDDKDWDDPVNIVDEFNVPVENGKATYTFTNLKIGSYHIFMTLDGMNGSFLGFQTGFTFYVDSPYVEAQTGTFDIGEIPSMNINFPNDANGTVNVIVYENYSKEVPDVYKTADVTVNGPTTIDLNTLIKDAGKFRVELKYSGNYGSFEKDYYIYKITSAEKLSPNLEVSATESVNVGDDVTINVSLNQTITGDVLVTVGGANYTVSVVNGKGSRTISNLPAGTYQVAAKFDGNDAFKEAQSTTSFKVNKVETPAGENPFNFDDNKTVESKTPTYSIDLPKDATGILTVTVGDKNYTAQVKDGKATVEINDLPAGSYDVTITYSGDDKYSPIVKTSKATVKVDPRIVAKDAKVQYTAGKYYSVTVYGDDGKVAAGTEVIFTLNNKQVAKTTTDANGVAKFKVTQTPVTNAKIVAKALGVSVTKKLTITHAATLSTVAVKKSAKKITLKVTVKVNGKAVKNKVVKFKFNNKNINTKKALKTNSKGVATVVVPTGYYKNLKVGKKVTYQVTYLKDTVKKTAKVKA